MRTEMASTVSRRLTWRREVEVNATINHPVEQVFGYLADPQLWPRFVPAVVFRRRLDPGPIGIGARWMATDRIGPFRVHFVDEMAALEPHRRVVWISSAPWNARVEYRCEAVGERTQVRATYEGVLDGRLRLLVGWLPRWATRLILAQLLAVRVSRSEDPAELPHLARHIEAIGSRVFMPAAILLFLAGAGMTLQAWSFGQTWIAISIALWIASAAAGALYLAPRARRVAALFDAEGPTSVAGRALLGRMFFVSRLELVSFAVIIGLMVLKPGS